jgi:predicted benzoate:H+ symporter BenE
MKLEIHHHYHFDNPLALAALERIERKLQTIQQQEMKAMAQLDDQIAALTADVENLKTVDAAAVALISGFSAQLAAAVTAAQAAGATPAQLQSLTDLDTAIKANTADLAAAVTLNTPAAPTP